MADGAGDLLAIANRFAVTGVPSRIEAHNGGHINDTWFVSTDLDRRYVLQRINPLVFPDAIGVVGNTGRVIAEIERRTVGLVPPFVAARDGSTAVVIGDSVYRMLGFVTGRGLDGLESVGQAAAAGLAFGRFQRALVHYDRSDHVIPIPRFHEVAFQLERFDQALDRPQPDRAKDASNDIARAQRARKRVIAESLGPYGMIHGDGKVTNLLFDEQDRVVAVLDLDTVMWGALAWDFGDLVRSAAAVGAEDARDIGFSIDRFRALAEGYMRGTGDLATAELRGALGSVPAYMAFMLALRFLIDYLDGDRYFRVAHPQHNLLRARSQFRLFRLMVDARADLDRIAMRV